MTEQEIPKWALQKARKLTLNWFTTSCKETQSGITVTDSYELTRLIAQALAESQPKLPSELTWIKNPCDMHEVYEFYDGSEFVVALQVNNNKTGETRWEFDTVRVYCDEDSFGMVWTADGDTGDEYSGWSFDDFEYIIPINEDAKATVKRWLKAHMEKESE